MFHVAALALVNLASAEALPGVKLDVTRAEAAVSCPDGAQLAAELARRTGPRAGAGAPLLVAVNLDADGIEYVATLHVSGQKQGERTLRAEGPSCDALHEALLVALLVLLDEDSSGDAPVSGAPLAVAPESASASPPTAPVPTALEPPDETPVRAPRDASRRPVPSLWLALGGGLTHGVPLDTSGALLFDLAVRVGHVEVSAGGFWAPSRPISTSAGDITVGTFGERLRGCYAWLPERRVGLRLLGCATGAIATLSGNGNALVLGHRVSRPWFLAGASAEATLPLSGRINVGISATGLATLHRERFSVDAVPDLIPFETDAVVAVFAARIEARLF
jgi:hypothetical protein